MVNQLPYGRLCVHLVYLCDFPTKFSPWKTQKKSNFISQHRPDHFKLCYGMFSDRFLWNSPQLQTTSKISIPSSIPSTEHNSTFIICDLVDTCNIFRLIWWVWRKKRQRGIEWNLNTDLVFFECLKVQQKYCRRTSSLSNTLVISS